MTNDLEWGISSLDDDRNEFMSETVTYTRGATVVSVAATLGQTDYEEVVEGNVVVSASAVDFKISAADLGLTPAVGDVIAFSGTTYLVVELPGQGAWRWSDPFHKAFRIHTKATS